MILLVLFLISGLVLGYLLSLRLKFLDSLFERLAFSVILGIAFSTLTCFAFSALIGTLSTFSIGLSNLLNTALCLILLRMGKNSRQTLSLNFKIGKIGLAEIAPIALFVILAYFNSLSLYEDGEGNIQGIANTWADYALHVGIINSFALRDNFPPIYPNLAGAPMRYPFLVDFLSAIFVKEGVPLIPSITLTNLILIFCLITLTFAFLKRFLGNRQIAALAMILFFLNGNLGFQYFFEDYSAAPDKMAFIAKLPRAYSSYSEINLQFMNLIFSVFIPQRAALMGFPLVMLLFIFLWRIYKKEAEKLEFLLAGFCLSLLPLIHASSFGVALGMSICIMAFGAFKDRKANWNWVVFILPVILFALPQLMFINEQQRSDNFFGYQPGWMSKAKSLAADGNIFIKFWLDNAGLTLILGVIGLFFLKRDQLFFLLPLLMLFALANLIRFQPWEWDNTKAFMYWYFALCAIAAIALQKGYLLMARKSKIAGTAATLALAFICIFSGILSLIYWNSSGAVLWSASDIRIANFIAASTPPDAVFAAAGKHNHIAYTLAGRQILAGYDGHLWSHGLIYSGQSSDNRNILSTADYNLMKKWNVGYVYIGYAETNEFGANMDLFLNNKKDFSEILEAEDGNIRIFKVNYN